METEMEGLEAAPSPSPTPTMRAFIPLVSNSSINMIE